MRSVPAPGSNVSGALRLIRGLGEPLVAIGVALLVCSVILLASGHNPAGAWSEFVSRALLRPIGLQEIGVRATPLLISGVAVLLAGKAGLWNIGVDGQVLAGALAAAATASALDSLPPMAMWLVAVMAGAITGGVWAAIPALLRARWGVNEIVTTIMFTYLAMSSTSWLVKGPLRDHSVVTPQTPLIPRADRLVTWGDTRVHIGFFIALALAAGVGGWLFKTRLGFEVRVTGESPRAARHAMYPVTGIIAAVLIVSGGIAATAGVNDILSTKGTFQAEWNPGYGLSAFALVFLARQRFAGLLPAALLLGMLSYGADVMPRAADIPASFFTLFEGVLLIVLAFQRWRPWTNLGERR